MTYSNSVDANQKGKPDLLKGHLEEKTLARLAREIDVPNPALAIVKEETMVTEIEETEAIVMIEGIETGIEIESIKREVIDPDLDLVIETVVQDLPKNKVAAAAVDFPEQVRKEEQ